MNLKDTFKISGVFSDSFGVFQNLLDFFRICRVYAKSLQFFQNN